MKIEKKEIAENIFSLKFVNQYECSSTFMRLQEFYESPFKEIRGQFFTLEKYMDRYAKAKGNFTYTLDWAGFNVPGKIVRQFFELFKGKLLEKEVLLCDTMHEQIFSDNPFYIIGHSEEISEKITKQNIFSVLAHEVAHGKYNLDHKYKRKMLNLMKELCPEIKKKISDKLLQMGYTKAVIKDETQAYLATSEPDYLKHMFKINKKDAPKQFVKLFKEFI